MTDAIGGTLNTGGRMSVEAFCTREVVHIETLESVADAARLMREHHVGCLVIVGKEGGAIRPVGIITDRDIAVRVVAEGLDPRRTPVACVMGTGVVTIGADESVRRALALMRSHGIRRLPVVDASGMLVGILAADDLLDFFAEEMSGMAGMLSREILRERTLHPQPGETVASVSARY